MVVALANWATANIGNKRKIAVYIYDINNKTVNLICMCAQRQISNINYVEHYLVTYYILYSLYLLSSNSEKNVPLLFGYDCIL